MIIQHKSNILSSKAITDLDNIARRTKIPTPADDPDYSELLPEYHNYYPYRYCSETYETKSDYNPTITRLTDKSIDFYTHNVESNDLLFVPANKNVSGGSVIYSKFQCLKTGSYNIQSTLIVTLENAAQTEWTVGTLKIHKNGGALFSGSSYPLRVTYPVIGNYYHPLWTWFLNHTINLAKDDLIEIVFNYDQELTGIAIGVNNDNIKCFLNINYENQEVK